MCTLGSLTAPDNGGVCVVVGGIMSRVGLPSRDISGQSEVGVNQPHILGLLERLQTDTDAGDLTWLILEDGARETWYGVDVTRNQVITLVVEGELP